MTTRETFLVLASNAPLLRADAIVVLCGEDCEPRLRTGLQLMLENVAPVVLLSGARHEPPHIIGAQAAAEWMFMQGLARSQVLMENESMNTHEQAVNVIQGATERGWKRLVLVASAYHQYRALLTFIRSLNKAGKAGEIHVFLAPTQAPWFQPLYAQEVTREARLFSEFWKMDEYAEDVATPAEGIAYLKAWEDQQLLSAS